VVRIWWFMGYVLFSLPPTSNNLVSLSGSTLALAYSQTHPDRVLGLILRGIFTLRREELLWFYQKGADFIFPDYFDKYKAAIPEAERGDMMAAYYKRLIGDNEEEKLKW